MVSGQPRRSTPSTPAGAGAPAGPGGAVSSRPIELVDRPGFRRLASGYDAVGRVAIPVVPHDRRIGFAEVETGYSEAEARLEGHRCLRRFDNLMLQPEL